MCRNSQIIALVLFFEKSFKLSLKNMLITNGIEATWSAAAFCHRHHGRMATKYNFTIRIRIPKTELVFNVQK